MIIAHRGGIPENTLDAFKNSTMNGVRAIEFDIHLTTDNEIVVIHDNNINGISINNVTYNELCLLKSTVPTLQQVLTAICETSLQYNVPVPIINIEIKPWGVTLQLSRFITEYVQSQLQIKFSDFVFTSFLHTELLELRKQLPLARIGFIYRCWPTNMAQTLDEKNVDLAVLSSHAITNKGIQMLLSNNIEIWVYTINDFSDAVVLLKECNVSGVITDIPYEMNNKIVNLI